MAESPLRAGDPERLGDYRLVGRLGEGGQGVVYLGETAAGERVAVKVVRARPSIGVPTPFARELAAARQVAEFCTARIVDARLDADPPYIVSEFVDGPSLQQVIESGGPLTGAVLHRLAIGTITALAAVHGAGVVHRDFKPSNVLVGPDGPRVIDFGIARLVDASTTTGLPAGTPPYMAPEHFHGDRIGPPADVFAWGSTITYAATGAPPFGRDTPAAIAYRIVQGEPVLGDLAGGLRDLVTRCLDKDPARRPTAREVLLSLLDDVPSSGGDVAALQMGRQAAIGQAPDLLAPGTTGGGERRLPRRALLAGAGAVVAALAGTWIAVARLPDRTGAGGAGPSASGPSPSGPSASGPFASGPGASPVPTAASGSSSLAAGGPTARVPASQASTAGGTTSPSASPARTSVPPPAVAPGTPAELGAAIDAAVTATPSARFACTGAFTESDTYLEADGRYTHDPAGRYDGSSYDMRVTYPGSERKRVVVIADDVHLPNGERLPLDLDPQGPAARGRDGAAAGAALFILVGSIPTILTLVGATPRVYRSGKDGRTYAGGVQVADAGYVLREFLARWLSPARGLDRSRISYIVTLDQEDLPVRFVFTWKASVPQLGLLSSSFTTTYREWGPARPIVAPAS
ncbi:protein kinase [Microbispora sp. NEAU-D428]|uniref:serine/threonine-protein kinase n=1 Tax=Microbispora sitophila TaxID=2771537 RepID=UPI001868C3F9|nr:serine/threonine-protein kinase [Microbispora sitophila]MBE3011068.1 protein kinase [Microbispora sitophila]